MEAILKSSTKKRDSSFQSISLFTPVKIFTQYNSLIFTLAASWLVKIDFNLKPKSLSLNLPCIALENLIFLLR